MVGEQGAEDIARSLRTQQSAGPRGLLAINKPWGWSSHDVVGAVRRIVGIRAVGHAGTLDPLATGILVVALGSATRVLESVMELPKTYVAEIRLGATSATDDAEGPLVAAADLPPLTTQAIETALKTFVGVQQQRPPTFAAIKVDGQAAYQAARRGEEVVLARRTVTIHGLALLRLHLPSMTLAIWCSRGTYIRALARDLGEGLGTGAYLAALVRSAVGPFHLRDALSLEQLGACVTAGTLSEHLYPLEEPLISRPVLVAGREVATDVRHGRSVAVPPGTHRAAGASWALGLDGKLLALGEFRAAGEGIQRHVWQPRRVFEEHP